MNVVRFRVKPEFKDAIVSKFAAFERPSGYQMGRLIQTGDLPTILSANGIIRNP